MSELIKLVILSICLCQVGLTAVVSPISIVKVEQNREQSEEERQEKERLRQEAIEQEQAEKERKKYKEEVQTALSVYIGALTNEDLEQLKRFADKADMYELEDVAGYYSELFENNKVYYIEIDGETAVVDMGLTQLKDEKAFEDYLESQEFATKLFERYAKENAWTEDAQAEVKERLTQEERAEQPKKEIHAKIVLRHRQDRWVVDSFKDERGLDLRKGWQ